MPTESEYKGALKRQLEEYYYVSLTNTYPRWELFYILLGVAPGLTDAQTLAQSLYNSQQALLAQIDLVDMDELIAAYSLEMDDEEVGILLEDHFEFDTDSERQAVLTALRNTANQ